MQKKQFFFQFNKLEFLIDYLLKGIVENQKYDLFLVSCYLNLDSAGELIKILENKQIILSSVSIFIDRISAINIGKEKLEKWVENNSRLFNVYIQLLIVNAGKLFHVKAYCLLSKDNNIGSLVIGSANLTGNGLTNPKGNIELLYDTQNIEHIHSFYEDLFLNNDLDFIELSQLEEFSNTDDDYFTYALLQEGYFIRSNNITINELLSFTYRFNTKGQKESKSDEFIKLGLKDKNSYSANYFQEIQATIENIFLKYNSSYHVNWGNYSITTNFGYWIPKSVVSYLNQESELEGCKKEIEAELNNYFKKAKNKMELQWKELLDKDWLTEAFKPQDADEDNEKKWEYIKNKTNETLKNQIELFLSNLDKLLFRYYVLKITFDFTNLEEIKILFNFLQEACIKGIGKKNYFNIKESQNLSESVPEIFNSNFDSDSKILLKCLSLSIRTKQLRFLRYLNREFFIGYVRKNEQSRKI